MLLYALPRRVASVELLRHDLGSSQKFRVVRFPLLVVRRIENDNDDEDDCSLGRIKEYGTSYTLVSAGSENY